jgi:hypothetical protein
VFCKLPDCSCGIPVIRGEREGGEKEREM